MLLCYNSYAMKPMVSHSRADETPEAKALWFRSLPLSNRMELLCFFTDLALHANPRIADSKDAQQTTRHIRILTKTQR